MSGGARAAGEDGVRPRRAEHAARSGGVLVGRAAGARRPSRAFRFDALMARRRRAFRLFSFSAFQLFGFSAFRLFGFEVLRF
ncbi:hypothetical protein [Burkholderia pseudomallei]|uniref:hypothetical protein n=1 Tax=Burkholderia pseudomallei TaxID=28450 RepID=UPI001AD76583|nr:hypothetical protein [Burkholderia pseudomallei]MBO7888047.1 hypothetical protein [Burkholderia pseudomallei]MBO7894615.1 hypothetical protein [Burkholderia pseudomallei]MBO7899257.1 hypothetical protein [Burkholderia pseudomallei]